MEHRQLYICVQGPSTIERTRMPHDVVYMCTRNIYSTSYIRRYGGVNGVRMQMTRSHLVKMPSPDPTADLWWPPMPHHLRLAPFGSLPCTWSCRKKDARNSAAKEKCTLSYRTMKIGTMKKERKKKQRVVCSSVGTEYKGRRVKLSCT